MVAEPCGNSVDTSLALSLFKWWENTYYEYTDEIVLKSSNDRLQGWLDAWPVNDQQRDAVEGLREEVKHYGAIYITAYR